MTDAPYVFINMDREAFVDTYDALLDQLQVNPLVRSVAGPGVIICGAGDFPFSKVDVMITNRDLML